MSEAEIFVRDLISCADCRKYAVSSTLKRWNFQKPCVQYETHAVWKPDPVKVLFVAESPPGTSEGYFYDPEKHEGYKEILRTELFRLLRIDGTGTDTRLAQFKKRAYFLSDAVKCRCDKGTRPQVPRSLATNCGRNWLMRELTLLKPDKVCTLGRAALMALATVPGYQELSTKKAGRDCGTIVHAKRPVLVWVFPSDRTSNYTKGKENVFSKFTQE
jgi:uracil-DNA glycosylase